MSGIDVIMSQYLTNYILPMFILICMGSLIASNFNVLKTRLIAKNVSKFDKLLDKIMFDEKKDLFKPLHEIVSADWKLRNKGLIRILEIGFRTGKRNIIHI